MGASSIIKLGRKGVPLFKKAMQSGGGRIATVGAGSAFAIGSIGAGLGFAGDKLGSGAEDLLGGVGRGAGKGLEGAGKGLGSGASALVRPALFAGGAFIVYKLVVDS